MSKKIMRVLVASTNPVKRNATIKAFEKVFSGDVVQCDVLAVPSGVADQPMTEAETKLGAQNRVRHCIEQDTPQDYDYYVAIEGGVDRFEDGAATFAYMAICDASGKIVSGRSANLLLPPSVYTRLKQGEELAHVMDDVFNEHNIRQKGGAIGILTNHLETRESVYTQALILALAPFMHAEHYQS